MQILQDSLRSALLEIKERGELRALPGSLPSIDFCSNDFLGLGRNASFTMAMRQLMEDYATGLFGATGSRLISGNSESIVQAESYIAGYHRVDASLIVPSGYMANLALFSTLPTRRDVVVHDERIHRSCLDGIKLAGARQWKFRHNDLNHLEDLLKRNGSKSWIAVESLYSMDGDLAPLKELVWLSERYQAGLIVDEAHAVGTFNAGLVSGMGLQHRVFATLVTYSKAMGQAGAAILGSSDLMHFLINRASPIIYSTAISPLHAIGIRQAYDYIEARPELSMQLEKNVAYFRELVPNLSAHEKSPIQPISLPSGRASLRLLKDLKMADLATYFVRSPSVPIGEERLRICLHQYNQPWEIHLLASIIKKYFDE